MLQAGLAVVERDAPIKSLIDLHFGSGEAEAASLLGDLEAAALPLHDVVVADDAFMHEAADTVEIIRSRAPCGLALARRPGEAAVVVGDELAQHGVGGVEVLGLGEAQFAGEAILEHAPETLDAAFGLRAVGSDEGDAELREGAAELGGLAFTGELFFDGPVVVVADEDAVVVAVKRLACARAASPSSRKRLFKRLIWRSLRPRSPAALAHANSPFTHLEITATRCSSFWLNANVSLFIG